MADEECSSASLRQLPVGRKENIMKMFENPSGKTETTDDSGKKSNYTFTSPYKPRPLTLVNSQGTADESEKSDCSRPKSETSTGPTVAKMMSRLQNSAEANHPKPRPRDLSPKKIPPEKPVIKKKSFNAADVKLKTPNVVTRPKSGVKEGEMGNDNSVSQNSSNVVQKRTQMFESASTFSPAKPSPPAIKPRSRPPSSNLDDDQKSPKHFPTPRSRPPSGNLDDDQRSPKHVSNLPNTSNSEIKSPKHTSTGSENSYCEAWDIKNKGKFEIIDKNLMTPSENANYGALDKSRRSDLDKELVALKSELGSPAKAPPKKPPRTGAHDEYMRVKLKSEASPAVPHYEHVPDEFGSEDKEESPVYRRIHKKSFSTDLTATNGTLKSKKPDRPPPPKPRPVTVSGLIFVESTPKSDKPKPVVPTKPTSPQKFQIYEDISDGLDLDKIKHWDLNNQPSLKTGLRRSLSAECIPTDTGMGSPIYVDPDSLTGFRDDTDCDIYVDKTGYAVPYRQRKRLLGHEQTKSLDPTIGICRPLSEALLKQLKKLKPAGKPKRGSESARNNWKKLQNVKMKINTAFAVLRHMRPEEKTQDEQQTDRVSGDEDSLVDLKEIEKRINHCGVVRRNTSKSIRKSRQIQTQIYPQLFEFCLIVGLQPKEDKAGFVPKVIYKFPAHGGFRIDDKGNMVSCSQKVDCNVSIPEFCFPDAEEFDVKTASPAAPSESYSFVLTNVDGERVFGYCRRLVPFTTKDGLPEVLCIISPVDAFSMYNELLDEVETCRHKSQDLAKELLSAAFGRPLPNPGEMVHVRTLDENWDMGTILLSRPSDSRADNVNREFLLSKLGVDKLLKLFSCILLERSVLFCAKSLSMLSQTIHALASLLYPFRWQHTYIPVLPESMLDVCCSPTPYMIGILSSQLSYVQTLPISEIVIFDLNKKQLIKSQGDEATILPKDIQKALKTALNMCKVDADAKSSQNLMISETFLRMFVEAVGHYRDHITLQQDGQKVFLKDNFILNAPSDSIQQFLQWFTETQMFEVFITEQTEKSYSKRKNSRALELFNQRIIELKEDSQTDFKKKNKNLLMKLLKT